jgi:hypothetical protein
MPEICSSNIHVPVNPSLPEINHSSPPSVPDLAEQMREAKDAWLAKSPSPDTRSN